MLPKPDPGVRNDTLCSHINLVKTCTSVVSRRYDDVDDRGGKRLRAPEKPRSPDLTTRETCTHFSSVFLSMSLYPQSLVEYNHHVSLLQYSYYTKYTHGRRKCVFVLVRVCESAECSFVCVLARARSTTTTVNVQKVKWNDYVWATLIVSNFGEINKLMTCTLATSWGMCIPMYSVIILHIII